MTFTTKEIGEICERENVQILELQSAIFSNFIDRYKRGEKDALEIVSRMPPKNARSVVLDWLTNNPGATYNEIPVKNAAAYLNQMLSYGVIYVSGTRVGRGRPKNEYSVVQK